jgi:uncharacterized protein YrrD
MLRRVKDILGYPLAAIDGEIGKIHDCLFDDDRWIIRYLVVDTGGWLSDRQVLISHVAVGKPDTIRKDFPVNLTRTQIEGSPRLDEDAPVHRQKEMEMVRYYGWPDYWNPAFTPGPTAAGTVMVETLENAQRDQAHFDPHLRSVREVSGYWIHARDGDMGRVKDFLFNDDNWLISYLILDTHKWLPGGKDVKVAPVRVKKINWAEKTVFLKLDKAHVKDSPEYDEKGPLDRQYEIRLYEHFNR